MEWNRAEWDEVEGECQDWEQSRRRWEDEEGTKSSRAGHWTQKRTDCCVFMWLVVGPLWMNDGRSKEARGNEWGLHGEVPVI